MNYEGIETKIIQKQNLYIRQLDLFAEELSHLKAGKEVKKLKKAIAELLDIVTSLKNLNAGFHQRAKKNRMTCLNRSLIHP